MDAILIFLVFAIALVVYVQHYGTAISTIVIWLSAAVIAVAFACLFFYPYSELGSMQAKVAHATNCFAAILGGVFTMVITACASARN